MLAYVDENGHFSSTPPDPRKKVKINVEDIEIGVRKQADIDPADLIRKGIVTFFNESKGYGFIKDKETQESVFVHVNSLLEPVKEHSKVTFEVEMGPKGANAVNVKLST
jgi:cold shock CspA family protein